MHFPLVFLVWWGKSTFLDGFCRVVFSRNLSQNHTINSVLFCNRSLKRLMGPDTLYLDGILPFSPFDENRNTNGYAEFLKNANYITTVDRGEYLLSNKYITGINVLFYMVVELSMRRLLCPLKFTKHKTCHEMVTQVSYSRRIWPPLGRS